MYVSFLWFTSAIIRFCESERFCTGKLRLNFKRGTFAPLLNFGAGDRTYEPCFAPEIYFRLELFACKTIRFCESERFCVNWLKRKISGWLEPSRYFWCGRQDLNLHVVKHQILNLACLPFHHARVFNHSHIVPHFSCFVKSFGSDILQVVHQ